MFWLVACSQSHLADTATDTGTGTPNPADTSTPEWDCPLEGEWQVDERCNAAELPGFQYGTGLARIRAESPGCSMGLDLVREVSPGDSGACHVLETLELEADGSTWSGTSAYSTTDPDNCWGTAAPQGFALGQVDLDVGPDSSTLTFRVDAPWSLSECAGTAALVLTPSSGR